MLPDTGERYLSTPLFADIPVEMNDAEIEISRSTPGFRFDIRPKAAPVAAPAPVVAPVSAPKIAPTEPAAPQSEPAPAAPIQDAETFYDAVLSDRKQPVVMFALEWCEFCWSARKLFAALEIDFRAVDLDSVAFQENDLGEKIREVLNARTGARTIPQIFIAGNRIGGATDTFDAYKTGALQEELRKAGVDFKNVPDLDPYHLLPNWMHSR